MKSNDLVTIAELVIMDHKGYFDKFAQRHCTLASQGKSLQDAIMEEYEKKLAPISPALRENVRISPELRENVLIWMGNVNSHLHLPQSWKNELSIPCDQESKEEWISYRLTIIGYSMLLDAYTRNFLWLKPDWEDRLSLIIPSK